MFRQGDVLIVPIAADAVPEGLRDGQVRVYYPNHPLILALGEATGHAHAVVAHDDRGYLFLTEGEDQPDYLHLPYGGRVVHEEHATIPLPEGWFKVVRQREYEPAAVRSWRMVAD
jgi:hypothetical protein